MSAGLDASTVTPGRTAPEASLTVPAMVPSTCAALTHGTLRSPRASSTWTHCRRTLRIGIRISPSGEPKKVFRYANRFSLYGPTYTPRTRGCQGGRYDGLLEEMSAVMT